MKATVAQLWKLIDADKFPTLNQELERELSPERGAKYEVPSLTGWKPGFLGAPHFIGYSDDHVFDVEEMRVGYVTQWIVGIGERGPGMKIAYVNMPSMTSGVVQKGQPFDCGRERVYSDTPKEELDRLIREGHAKFVELLKSLEA